MKKKIIGFGEPCISKKEREIIIKTLKSKWLGAGPLVKKFEKNFSYYKKIKYSSALNSCTSALFLSLKLIGIKKGDEVITTPLTWCSTINSIIHAGAKPVLVDIDKNTLNIDHHKIEKKINNKTRAIIPVHFAGLPCEMDEIMEIAVRHKIQIIEDCAHAIESKFNDRPVGSFGITGCFSFYANKNITTGDGGMITTNNKKIYELSEIYKFNGLSKHAWERYRPSLEIKSKKHLYDVMHPGFKFNMTDLQAGLGIEQLKKINFFWKKRKEIFNIYKRNLLNLPIKFQEFNQKKIKHAYHLFLFYIDKNKTKKTREKLVEFLKINKIGFGIHYPSITDMTYYKKEFKWTKKTTPISLEIGRNTISLPLYPHLKKKEVHYICSKIKKFFFNDK
jgi:dTDP-4-amino-4,6-dideoxygalactose transaminase